MSGLDPFAGLNLEMQAQARCVQPPQWCLGRVTAVGPGVLRIVANGHELDEEDLWVDPRLLAGHEPPVKVKVILTAPAEGEEKSGSADDEAGGGVTLDVGGTYVRTFIDTGLLIVESIPLWELPGTLTGTFFGTLEVLDNRLQVGDWVALLPDANEEFYYVLTKVVRP